MRRPCTDPKTSYDRRWLTLAVVCVGLMVITLDNTILNVALPTLARHLHASTSSLQWIVDVYVLVFAGLLLTAGSLGDRFGRYKALTFGLVVFGTGSLLSALASSSGMLVATRAFMGIGGAFIMPSTLSIITNLFTEPSERAKAIGVWAGVAAIGVGIGPITGGFLLSHFYWGSVFFVNIPIVIVSLIGGWFLIPDSRDPSTPRLDPVGAVLSMAGLATLLWAIIEAPSHGWTSTPIVVGFAVGAVVTGLFVGWELYTPHPMLDMRFFRNPRFTAASGAVTLTFFSLFGSLFLLTQYLQAVLGYSALKAGAVQVPQAAAMMIIAPTSPRFVQRFGSKAVVGVGLLIVAAGMLLYARLPVGAPAWEVIFSAMVLGVGMGNVMAPATDSIMGSLPREKAGVGSAVNDTTRQTGGAIGVAVLGSALASRFHSSVGAAASAAHLPASVSALVRRDIVTALATSRTPAGRPYAATIGAIARHGFVSAFHLAAIIGAVTILIAAAGVFMWLPARAEAPAPAEAPVEIDVAPALVVADA